ncbi:hypothetical protein B0H14DRAFT_2366067, partial [Mycena olivaceomarginata]
LPPEQSDGRPAGVFDVNEGSKKGIIKMLKALQELSGLSESEWAAKARIIVGDWLTSNNIRGARKDRMDDINSMERLEYVEELSALWHFALNATHMILRLHFGDSVLDPGSLAKHKGLLNRTWDAEKPNYADAKALIRHSLIARIFNFAQDFVAEFTEAINAQKAKNINDDYYAHSQYFIRDALIFCVFEHAVAFADAGIVLRVLKFWALSFRGAGLHNYARECIEIALHWKYELTPEMQAAKERAWFYADEGARGLFVLMFGLFVARGISRHRQNGACTEPNHQSRPSTLRVSYCRAAADVRSSGTLASSMRRARPARLRKFQGHSMVSALEPFPLSHLSFAADLSPTAASRHRRRRC